MYFNFSGYHLITDTYKFIYIYTFRIDYNIVKIYKMNEFFDDFLTRMNFHCAGATFVQATAKLTP